MPWQATGLALALVGWVYVFAPVSPMAAVRSVVVVLAGGAAITAFAIAAAGDRRRGGIAALLAAVGLVVAKTPILVVLALVAAVSVVIEARVGRSTDRSQRRWYLVDRTATAGVVIILLAVGIAAVQRDVPPADAR